MVTIKFITFPLKKITAVKDNKYTQMSTKEMGWCSDSVLHQRLAEIQFRGGRLIFWLKLNEALNKCQKHDIDLDSLLSHQ